VGNVVPVTVNGSDRDRIFEVGLGKNVLIKELTLEDGYARVPKGSGMGGAILDQGNLTLDTDVLNYNRAYLNGGAIEAATTAGTAGVSVSLRVLNSSFTGNRAIFGSGGAISNRTGLRETPGVNILVDSTTFYGNTAALTGGAIDFDIPVFILATGGFGASSLTVQSTNSTSFFQGNEAADGGAIHFGTSVALNGGTAKLYVNATTFDSNDAFGSITAATNRGAGGAINMPLTVGQKSTAISAVITYSTFTGNWANFGGAVNTTLKTSETGVGLVSLDQDSLSFNQAVLGGAIYQDENGNSVDPSGAPNFVTSVTLTNSNVDNNVATSIEPTPQKPINGAGGGIFATVQGNRFTLMDYVNDTVAYNSAVTSTFTASRADGGGILLTGSNPNQTATISLNSLTVAYNYADNDGGGTWVPMGSVAPPLNPWVRNCIFDSNTAGGIGPNVFGSVLSLGHGYNILNNAAGSIGFTDPTDLTASPSGLDTQLALNGGSTLNLMPSSPMVVGNGFPAPAQFDDPTLDQRGFNRAGPTSRGAVDPNGF
jgi:hypothetical protein